MKNTFRTLGSEFWRLSQSLLLWAGIMLTLSVVIFSVGFDKVQLAGRSWYVPVVTAHSMAAMVLAQMSRDFLPAGARLIVTNPFSIFSLETEISLLLAILIMLPYTLIAVLRYLSPALYRHERNVLLVLTIPAFLLFFGGAAAAYFFIIPQMFHFLFGFVSATGAEPLYSAADFYSSVLSILTLSGFMFELPVCMVVLSFLGIVSPAFWRKKWGYALLTFLILTAIITPDASGVSMVVMTALLMLLYLAGSFVSVFFARARAVRASS